MDEWAVVGVIVVLVGLVATVAGPIVKMTKAVTTLTDAVDRLSEKLKTSDDRNTQSHSRIYQRLDDCDDQLAGHETRITVLERKPQ